MSVISAVIITRDEATHIASCILSLKKIVDEVIVVDSGSIDDTCLIAESLGARVFRKSWEGFGANKNFGHLHARNDWILSIDADEIVSNELSFAISSTELAHASAFELRRVNYYKGRRVRFGALYPRYKTRLFNRLDCHWDDKQVHEELIFRRAHKVRRLNGELYHFIADNLEQLSRRSDAYALLSAEEWIRKDLGPGRLKMILSPMYHFLRSFFFQLGFLEGIDGLKTSWLSFLASRQKINYYKSLNSK